MNPLEEHITRINSKLQELLKKHAALVKENAQQLKNIRKLEDESEKKEARIKILEQQQHILKAAAGKMNDQDRKSFEQEINKYIREIDKCINFLNE